MAHYYVPRIRLPEQVLEVARRLPDNERLQEGELSFGSPEPHTPEDLRLAADKLLRGEVDIPGLPRTRVMVPFSPDDVDKGPGSWQLWFSALALPRVLVRAYHATGDDQYLLAARDMILGWARYERSAWLPRGLLWNDHAIAARIGALAMFWRAYRNHPTYDPEVARTLFEFLARSGQMLASPGHFTPSTNHGVMQNLALLQLALAFPSLPDTKRYQEIALTRLQQQMAFYMNDEGVVLEHSLGYHRFGLALLGRALRYLELMRLSPPAAWPQKYRLASQFLAQLELPDGSLPVFGDTDLEAAPGPGGGNYRAERSRANVPRSAPEAFSLYPLAGYSIWWRGLGQWPNAAELSQTVVAWSYFRGHAHKHADEMSLWLWAAGRMWWGNTGYWPYDLSARAQVESWSGSNAPHLVGEAARSERTTELLSSGWSEGLAGLHLARRGPNRYQAERQVIHLPPNVWIVVDHVEGQPDSMSRTVWTTSPTIQLSQDQTPRSYRLRPSDSGVAMSATFVTSPGATLRQLQGSVAPFAGWAVVDSTPTPAPALVIDQPASNSWAIAAWCLEVDWPRAYPCPAQPGVADFSATNRWTLRLPSAASAFTVVERTANTIRVHAGDKAETASTLDLQPPADISARRAELRLAHAAAVKLYPRFRDLTYYRARVSVVVLAVLVVQEALFAFVPAVRRRYRALRSLSIVSWALLAFWLTTYYFG